MKKHIAVVGLAYGDEAKGTVVNRLCSTGDYSAVVRFNGGCQAAHNVVLDDGTHHTFAQFGSGTLLGVQTYLSKYMIVEPFALLNEAYGLTNIGVSYPMAMLTVHPKCLVTTPYHWWVTKAREDARGDARHGSTGRGVGATVEYSLQDFYPLRIEDLQFPALTLRKLLKIEKWAVSQGIKAGTIEVDLQDLANKYHEFFQQLNISDRLLDGKIVFEGAQGVLLDEHVGFHPYTTWSTVTPDNIFNMVERDFVEVIGVTRSYMTRHGAGPFITEDTSLNLPEIHNKDEKYQGIWRVGHLDIPALRYSISACGGIDGLYVTHGDAPEKEPNLKMCVGYVKDSVRRRLYSHVKNDLDLRASQSELLKSFIPIYADYPENDLLIADMLGTKLFGYGDGPKTSSGTA